MRAISVGLLFGAAALTLSACGPRGVQTTDTKDEADADTDADSDADSDSDTDTDPGFSCDDGPGAAGPWDDHPLAVAGVPVTTDAYTVDAGVQAVNDAAAGQIDPLAVSLPVNGAIIISKGYVPANPTDNTLAFWFEDANAAGYAFYVDVGVDPNTVQVGDEVSFTVTEVTDYFGTPEVTAITDFTVLSSGNPVRVIDATDGTPLDLDTMFLRNVEVWGELVAGPEACGGSSQCFDFDYFGNIAILRTESSFTYLGDCVHWIGPLGSFQSEPQMNADDFDWYTYF